MKRTVAVSTPGTRLAIRDSQLVIRSEDSELAHVPIEDLGVLVLEGPGIHLTSGTLQYIGATGGTVLACDERHLPACLTLAVVSHSLHSEKVRHQSAAAEPLKKNLWAEVVRAKIRNQQELVTATPANTRLQNLRSRIRSGDAGNGEAQAARHYWPALFSNCHVPDAPFRRQRDGAFPNCLLNYGYAILRAAAARSLCGAGLHPGLGMKHRNRYSSFPLADDLMEPFRPWVDKVARDCVVTGSSDLGKKDPRCQDSCRLIPAPASRLRGRGARG